MKPVVLPALLLLALAASGCTPIGAGLAVGGATGTAAAREGGIKASLEDARISATIHDLWLKHDAEMFIKVGMTVDQGRVLLTGVVQKPEHRVEAVRLAWQAQGVRQVINEIKVANSEGIKGWARDVWISGRLRASILFDKNIQGVNYSIDTVQSIVYLMGVAQDQVELNKVMSYARTVPYVKQVVSYVKLAGTPMNQVIANGGPNAVGMAPAQPMGATDTIPPISNRVPNYGAGNTGSGGLNNPAPVSSEPLYSRQAVPMGAMPADTGNYNARMPNVPNPPPAGVMAPGRPAPIVDSGF